MSCKQELDFLNDVLKKCHIGTKMLAENDSLEGVMDSLIGNILGVHSMAKLTIQEITRNPEDATKYIFTNELKMQYIFMRLPIEDDKNILFIGPYLTTPMTTNEILEIGERMGLAPNTHRFLLEYYATLPVVSEHDRVLILVDTFCERVWQSPAFAITEIDRGKALTFAAGDEILRNDDFDETLANIERMERRYAFENELIQAVVLGQQHKEKLLLTAFDNQMFEKRLTDPVRNVKNYCIIMNTLLRKAAEQGGVHPLDIDNVSSKFAKKIEMVAETKDFSELMREMFSSYCRLVRKRSSKQYPAIVQKTILLIDSDISANISLQTLAKKQGITSEYLATVFKRETGKTVMEYVRDKRIQQALFLLNTTNLQIQTIAMHCGIMDVQYFSRVFKKEIGKTPKEYRRIVRH